jgi:hypothetical protein
MITSTGRQRIHKHLISIVNAGGTPFSVDCDSISYSLPNDTKSPLQHSMLFGDFKVVFPGQVIKSFCSITNKNYCLTTELPEGKIVQTIRMKGISLKNEKNFKMVTEAYTSMVDSLLDNSFRNLKVKQQRVKRSRTLMEVGRTYNDFFITNNASKKRIQKCEEKHYYTVPYGYDTK